MVGFPRTVASATLFSRILEQVYTVERQVEPTAPLVDMPKGSPPPLTELYPDGQLSGHVCVVGLFLCCLHSHRVWFFMPGVCPLSW